MRLLTTVSILALASLLDGSAFAQEADQPQNNGIGDIVVTAQKRSENIQDVPIAISAVDSQYLESRGIDSIYMLGTIAPP